MENVIQYKNIANLCAWLNRKFKQFVTEYNIEFNISFFIVNDEDIADLVKNDVSITTISNSVMTTQATYSINSDDIISDVDIVIFANYTEILATVLSYYSDIGLTAFHLEHILRHEFGHALYDFTLIGKPLEKLDEDMKIYKEEISKIPKLRSNASYKSMFNKVIRYSNVTMERIADEFAGLSIKTWVIDFVLANPGVSRKKLGVEEYLTKEEFDNIKNLKFIE